MKISGQTVKGIIFDVDGTLLDTVEIWVTASSRYVRSQGLVPEPGLDESLFSMSMEEIHSPPLLITSLMRSVTLR